MFSLCAKPTYKLSALKELLILACSFVKIRATTLTG